MRVPCKAGEVAVTVTSGSAPASELTRPEIVPVGLAYDRGVEFTDDTFVEHVLRVAARKRTRCTVSIGAPRSAQGKPQQLADQLQAEVQALVQDARTSWERGRP